jgi:hypothetical protein
VLERKASGPPSRNAGRGSVQRLTATSQSQICADFHETLRTPTERLLPDHTRRPTLKIIDSLIEVHGTDLGQSLGELSRTARAAPADCEFLCDTQLYLHLRPRKQHAHPIRRPRQHTTLAGIPPHVLRRAVRPVAGRGRCSAAPPEPGSPPGPLIDGTDLKAKSPIVPAASDHGHDHQSQQRHHHCAQDEDLHGRVHFPTPPKECPTVPSSTRLHRGQALRDQICRENMRPAIERCRKKACLESRHTKIYRHRSRHSGSPRVRVSLVAK